MIANTSVAVDYPHCRRPISAERRQVMLEFDGVAVQERAVDEDGDVLARKRDVDTTARAWPMAAPTTKPMRPERAAKESLGACVLRVRARHDSRRPSEDAGGERSMPELPAASLFIGAESGPASGSALTRSRMSGL